MATNTTAVAKQVRLQQWAQQITDCQNRPVGMKVIDWCDANGIILPKLTTITGLSRFGNSVWNLWNKRKLLSSNFLNAPSGWTKSELNFFIQRRMRNQDKTFIIVNFDVPHDELPPLVQDYRYIDFKEKDAIDVLINTLQKKLN